MPNRATDQQSEGHRSGESDSTIRIGDREVHVPGGGDATVDPNRMLSRRSPVGQSRPSTVSRDYQPRTGGPELVASWPLGAPPSQTEPGGEDWEVTDSEYVTLQKNYLNVPYVAPIECSILYLNVCGRAATSADDETLTLGLTTDHLEVSGEPYETSIDLSAADGEYFLTPMIEFAPDTGEYEPGHDIVSGYELRAKVSGGTGHVDQGTAVQLWSE
jgi:hypothetical protein